VNISISIANLDLRGIDRIREKIDNSKFAEAGASSLAPTVRRHLLALNLHKTRDWLNSRSQTRAQPTQHFRKGAAAVYIKTGNGEASVVVPIPGISRAFHALEIAPRTAGALTIPLNSIAYGKRVGELRAEGWRIFRGRGRARRVLFGAYNGEVRGLYALLSRVRVPQDRSLLPSDQQVNAAVKRGAQLYINSISGK
jgi:hypothetical protein